MCTSQKAGPTAARWLISQQHVALVAIDLGESWEVAQGALVPEPLKEAEGVCVPWTHRGAEGRELGFQQTLSLPYSLLLG